MTDTRESLDEQLSKAFDMAMAADKPAEVEETPAIAVDETPATDTRERDEGGRFKAKDQAAENAPADAIKDADKEDGAGQKPPEVTQPVMVAVTEAAIQPPVSLSAAAKAEWSKTPPAIQQDLLKRENDIARYVQQTSATLKQHEAISAQIEPHRKQIEQWYGDVPTGLKTLFDISNFAQQSPYDYMRYFVQQRGLDPQQVINVLAGGQVPQAQPAAFNPQLATLMQEVVSLKQHRQQEEQLRAAEQEKTVKQKYEEFANNPANKHFEALREDMALLLENGLAKDFSDAYEQAKWRNPQVRAAVLAEQHAEQEAKRKADVAAHAKKASNAAAVAVATKGGAIGSPRDKKNLDDVMSDAYDRAMGAA